MHKETLVRRVKLELFGKQSRRSLLHHFNGYAQWSPRRCCESIARDNGMHYRFAQGLPKGMMVDRDLLAKWRCLSNLFKGGPPSAPFSTFQAAPRAYESPVHSMEVRSLSFREVAPQVRVKQAKLSFLMWKHMRSLCNSCNLECFALTC